MNTSDQHVVKLPIQLDLPEGRIEGEVELPRGSMRLVDLAAATLGLSSTVSDIGARITGRLGRQVSCSKGCGACCRQVVPVSPPEAFMLAELVASMPNDYRKQIQERFADAVRKLDRSGLLPKLDRLQAPSSLGEEDMRNLSRAYFKLQIPCPFLEDESCGIYAYRPSRCREFLVVSPASHCSNPFEQTIERLPVSIRLSQALGQLWSEATKTPLQLVPLTLVSEWSEAHRSQRGIGADSKQILDALLYHITQIAVEYERQNISKLKSSTPTSS